MDPDELPELDDDDLDTITVEVPLADHSPKPAVREADRFGALVELSDKLILKLAEHLTPIRTHLHDPYVSRYGKTVCSTCRQPMITPKQAQHLSNLWKAIGTMSGEAQDFIHGLTVNEACLCIDLLLRRR